MTLPVLLSRTIKYQYHNYHIFLENIQVDFEQLESNRIVKKQPPPLRIFTEGSIVVPPDVDTLVAFDLYLECGNFFS